MGDDLFNLVAGMAQAVAGTTTEQRLARIEGRLGGGARSDAPWESGVLDHEIPRGPKQLVDLEPLERRLVTIELMLGTLIEALANAGVIDRELIRVELEARLAKMQAPPPEPPPEAHPQGGGYRDAPASARAERPKPLIACAKCGLETAKDETFLTGCGAVCAACHADME